MKADKNVKHYAVITGKYIVYCKIFIFDNVNKMITADMTENFVTRLDWEIFFSSRITLVGILFLIAV